MYTLSCYTLVLMTFIGSPFVLYAQPSSPKAPKSSLFIINSITPNNEQINTTDDKLFIGTDNGPCQLQSHEKTSNIDPGENHITYYTLEGFKKAFSLQGKITCLKFSTNYNHHHYTTGDIKLIEKKWTPLSNT